MEIGVAVYWQMIVNGFFFGIGVMAAFAAGAFVLAIMALKIFRDRGPTI